MPSVLLGILLPLAILAAAKAHGRQVRLERELEGHATVVFGGENPPFVVALWAKDRRIFWSTAGIVAFVAGGAILLRTMDVLAALAAGAVLGFTSAFVVAGLASAARFRRALRERLPDGRTREEAASAERSDWLRAALRASIAWWLVVAALAAATVVSSL